jgi:hypothetical protein
VFEESVFSDGCAPESQVPGRDQEEEGLGQVKVELKRNLGNLAPPVGDDVLELLARTVWHSRVLEKENDDLKSNVEHYGMCNLKMELEMKDLQFAVSKLPSGERSF